MSLIELSYIDLTVLYNKTNSYYLNNLSKVASQLLRKNYECAIKSKL